MKEKIEKLAEIMGWESDDKEWKKDGRFVAPIEDEWGECFFPGWNPFERWGHTGMLIDRMLELGYFYSAYQREIDDLHNWGFFKKGDFGQTPRQGHLDIKTAICEAALVAYYA